MAGKKRWSLARLTAILLVAGPLAAQGQGAPSATPSPEELLRQTSRELKNAGIFRFHAEITFDEVALGAADVVGEPGGGEQVIASMFGEAVVGLSALTLGVGASALEQAAAYTSQREQFGRPIGSFQSIKHICADLLVDVEAAKSAARHAAACVDRAPAELPVAASLAKSFCSEAYARAAEASLQIHGGVGFTWEHACHLYLKRARSSERLLGDPLHHRERLADLVGL